MSRSRHLSAATCVVAIVLSAVALASCGSKGQGSGTATTSSSPSPSQAPSTTPTPTTATTSPSPTSGGATVPAGFKATSVTFVSTNETFVLGTAPGHGAVVVRSRNRGATWARLAAPSVHIGWPQSQIGPVAGVWGIRFATASHGFVFGKGLWETTDGGATWTRTAAPSGSILSLATIDGQVLVLVQPGPQSQSATLLRRPLTGGPWSEIATIRHIASLDPTDLISTQAGVAAVLDAHGVLVTTDGGLTDSEVSTPTNLPAGYAPTAVAATSARSLALLVGGGAAAGSVAKLVYVSASGGATWTRAGAPSRGGDPVTIAGGSPGTLLVGAASGGSEIYRSTDGGHAWRTALNLVDSGAGWADLGFTTLNDAVVIHGPVDTPGNFYGRPGQLLLSANGGATWRAVTF